MDISVFTKLLHSELLKLGISKDDADKYIRVAWRGLSSSDVAKTTEADIVNLARLCAAQIQSKNPPKPSVTEDSMNDSDSDEIILGDVFVEEIDASDESVSVEIEDDSELTQLYISKENITVEPIDETPVPTPKKKNSGMFVLITALSSPLWIIAAILFVIPFAVMFATEALITAGLVCLLAAFAALGTAAALTGIVYGIVKMFSVPAIGLYEIGFGIIIAGVTMILGILIYNGTVRFMPWLFKKSGTFVKLVFSKVKPLLAKYKRRCESL